MRPWRTPRRGRTSPRIGSVRRSARHSWCRTRWSWNACQGLSPGKRMQAWPPPWAEYCSPIPSGCRRSLTTGTRTVGCRIFSRASWPTEQWNLPRSRPNRGSLRNSGVTSHWNCTGGRSDPCPSSEKHHERFVQFGKRVRAAPDDRAPIVIVISRRRRGGNQIEMSEVAFSDACSWFLSPFPPRAIRTGGRLAGDNELTLVLKPVRLARLAQGLRGLGRRGRCRCGGTRDDLVVRRCPDLSSAIPVQYSVAPSPGAGRRPPVQLAGTGDAGGEEAEGGHWRNTEVWCMC